MNTRPEVGDLKAIAPKLPRRVVAAVLALFVFGVSDTGSQRANAGKSSTATGHGALLFGSSFTQGSRYNRFDYLFVGRADAARAARLRGKRVLVYHSGTDINKAWNTGVSYAEAKSKGWVLTTTDGAEVISPAYPDNVLGDVGQPAYQRRWVNSVLRFVRAAGADGVFIDNVHADISGWSAGVFPAKYPDNASWEDAMASFITYVGQALQSRGTYVVVNAGKFIADDSRANSEQLVAQWWRRLSPYVDGFMREYWQQSSVDVSEVMYDAPTVSWMGHWAGWQRLIRVAQRLGRDFFGVQYGDRLDSSIAWYGRASFLLEWNSNGGAYIFHATDGSESLGTEWMVGIGNAVGRKYRVGVGWRREYSHGTVLVNPSRDAMLRLKLGGEYLLPDGTRVLSVTIPPLSGLILRSARPTTARRA